MTEKTRKGRGSRNPTTLDKRKELLTTLFMSSMFYLVITPFFQEETEKKQL